MRPVVRLHFQDMALALALAVGALACSGTVGGGQNPVGGGTAGTTAGTPARARPGSSVTGVAGSTVTGAAGSGVHGHLPDDGDHADAAAPADQVRIREHGPEPAERRRDRRPTTCPPTRSRTASTTTPAS